MFYAELVKVESIIVALDELNLKDDHKKHLSKLVDSTIHHTIMDLILSKLSKSDQAEFIKIYNQDPRSKEIMKFLNSKISGIDQEIEIAAKKLKVELHEDIKEARKVTRIKNQESRLSDSSD